MKKLIPLSLLIVSLVQPAEARKISGKLMRNAGNYIVANAALKTASAVSKTVFPASFSATSPCAGSIGTYYDTSFGYYAGVNAFGDKEVLMRYSLPAFSVGLPATVDTVKVLFGAKYVSGNGKLRAKVYSATSSGEPTTLLGTSSDLAVSSVDTTGFATNFVFPSPVTLTTATFFVAVDVSSLYATGDSVGILSTDDQCSTTDPTDAWTMQNDDMFYAFSDANNWDMAVDLGIFAHVNAHALSVSNASVNTFGANVYPVPADNKLTVSFSGLDNGIVSIALKDITGKTAAFMQQETTPGASYKVPIDVSRLSSGLYFVELSSGDNRSLLKVTVQ